MSWRLMIDANTVLKLLAYDCFCINSRFFPLYVAIIISCMRCCATFGPQSVCWIAVSH